MVSMLVSAYKSSGLSPDQGYCIVFLAGQEKTQVRLFWASKYYCALGQVKMEVWWSNGQVKLASVVSVAVADNDREQDQAGILPPLPQLLCSDTDTE